MADETTGSRQPDEGIVERVGRDRLRFRRDVLPDIAGWLMLLWDRQDSIIRAVEDRGGPDGEQYRTRVIAEASARMEHLAQMISELPDTYRAADYASALQAVGRLIAASDDHGRPVSRLGRAIRGDEGASGGATQG